MEGLLQFLPLVIFLGVYFVLTKWVLPALGFPT